MSAYLRLQQAVEAAKAEVVRLQGERLMAELNAAFPVEPPPYSDLWDCEGCTVCIEPPDEEGPTDRHDNEQAIQKGW